jgi:hypothetical protein
MEFPYTADQPWAGKKHVTASPGETRAGITDTYYSAFSLSHEDPANVMGGPEHPDYR